VIKITDFFMLPCFFEKIRKTHKSKYQLIENTYYLVSSFKIYPELLRSYT